VGFPLNSFYSSLPLALAPEFYVRLARARLQVFPDRLTLPDLEGEVIAATGTHARRYGGAISSAGAQLCDTGDVVLHPLYLEHAAWLPICDALPEQAADSRRARIDPGSTFPSLAQPGAGNQGGRGMAVAANRDGS